MMDPQRSRNRIAGTPIAVLPEASDVHSICVVSSRQEYSIEYVSVFEAESGPQTEPLDDERQPLDDHGPYCVCVPPGTHR